MRKQFILTGLFVASTCLACLISAERSPSANSLKNNKTVQQASLKAASPGHAKDVTFASTGGANNPDQRKKRLERLGQLQKQLLMLEQTCADYKLVLEKAGIADSVYDQYDNPEGRLSRYKVGIAVKQFFELSRQVRSCRQQVLELQAEFSR